jgi:DNA-directed RNA polymerase subunit H (RpoH/RPB5)
MIAGSTREKEEAQAKALFGQNGLFPLARNASADELEELLEKLKADKAVGAYVRMTKHDIVPSHLLKEIEEACRLLRGNVAFWSSVLDQTERPTGAPGNHPERVIVWALWNEAEHIWDKYI